MPIRGHRDFPTYIPPGGVASISATGEFVYVKYTDRTLRVVIDGNPMLMERGDFSRFPQAFQTVEVYNTDPQNPANVILVAGFGEFDRKIVTGEITVNPGIRTGSGAWLEDTRQPLEITLKAEDIVNTDWAAFAEMDSYQRPFSAWGMATPLDRAGKRWLLNGLDNGDALGWALLEDGVRGPWKRLQHEFGISSGDLWGDNEFVIQGDPGTKLAALRFYDRHTLQLKRRVPITGATYTTTNPRMEFCAVTSAGKIVAGIGGQPYEIDPQSGDARLIRPGAFCRMAFNWNGLFWIAYGAFANDLFAFNPATLEEVPGATKPTIPLPWNDPSMSTVWCNGEKFFTFEGNWVYPNPSSRPTTFKQFAAQDLHYSISAAASRGSWRLFQDEYKQLLAPISAAWSSTGMMRVSGALIQGALEAFTKTAMPADYLDYVYGVEFEDGKVITSGGASFAAEGVADDFVTELPHKLKITLRRGLL